MSDGRERDWCRATAWIVLILAGMCLLAALLLHLGCALHLHVGERHYHGDQPAATTPTVELLTAKELERSER